MKRKKNQRQMESQVRRPAACEWYCFFLNIEIFWMRSSMNIFSSLFFQLWPSSCLWWWHVNLSVKLLCIIGTWSVSLYSLFSLPLCPTVSIKLQTISSKPFHGGKCLCKSSLSFFLQMWRDCTWRFVLATWEPWRCKFEIPFDCRAPNRQRSVATRGDQ